MSETSTEFFDNAGNDIAEWENLDDGLPVSETQTEPADSASAPADATTDDDDAGEQEAEAPSEDTEPEPEPEEEPDPAALREQIAQLEKRIQDKDDFNGRLSNELGELRQRQQQLEQQPAPVSDWDDLLDTDPMGAAEYALQTRDQRRLDQAKQAMDEYLPGSSRLWERGLAQQHRLDQLAQQMEQTAAPIQEQHNAQQVANALQRLNQTYPDAEQLGPAMQNLVTERPLLMRSLQAALVEGTPDEQYAALEDLYLATAGRGSDTLREAGKQVAREHAAETLRAKQEAQTVSASAHVDNESSKSVGEQLADQIGAEWDEIEKPYRDGWNISPV